ncbi:MAG: T9SS type A sorting domain-containing protein [bacterium]|nr:T9SS type A sorting domain-containing protein [bacterium]
MKWRMMFLMLVLALASVTSAAERPARSPLDDCDVDDQIRLVSGSELERTGELDSDDDSGSCGRRPTDDATYELDVINPGLYSFDVEFEDWNGAMYITTECCGGDQLFPRGLTYGNLDRVNCMWLDEGTYYLTIEGRYGYLLSVYSCDNPCDDNALEPGFTYSEGYVTFLDRTDANSDHEHYDGPWEMEGAPCQQSSANPDNQMVGFGFYNWYNQDYGWSHLFDLEGLECLDYSIDSAFVVICAYENDNCEEFGEPSRYYSDCQFDAVLSEGDFLGALNPDLYPGTNLSYSSTRLSVPVQALEDGVVEVFLDIDAGSTQCAWATTVLKSELLVYMSCRQIPPGPEGYDLGDLPFLDNNNEPCYPTGSVQQGGPANAVFAAEDQVAWLGECVNHELVPNTVDEDGCDDGVYFIPSDRPGGAWYPGDEVCVEIMVSTGPAYNPNVPLYLWGWKDGNLDCDFDDLLESPNGEGFQSECIIPGHAVPPMGPNQSQFVTVCFGDPGVLNMGHYDGHLRFRLITCEPGNQDPARDVCDCFTAQTYIDDALGETEDFIITDLQLPIELQSFTASGAEGRVVLSWTTATEQANDAFEVQRWFGTRWERVGHLVPGAGNSASQNNYIFADSDVEVGTSYRYRLVTIDVNGNRMPVGEVESLVEPINTTVNSFALHQNYPNPFNPATQITYDLAKATDVSLTVFDLLGREIATLVKGPQAAGRYVVDFDAAGLPSGMYFYRLETAQFTDMKKMVLLK